MSPARQRFHLILRAQLELYLRPCYVRRSPDVQSKLRLGFREVEIDTNRPFTDGTVKVEGFDLEINSFRGPEVIDAWDTSFGVLMQTKGQADHPYVSIPVFPTRKFRLSYIFVNSAAGISSPKDLEGNVCFSSTADIWARGALLDHYGVDLPASTGSWAAPKQRAEPRNPCRGLPKLKGLDGNALDSMLVEGTI